MSLDAEIVAAVVPSAFLAVVLPVVAVDYEDTHGLAGVRDSVEENVPLKYGSVL